MGATLRALGVILAELWPFIVLAVVVGLVLWRRARPALAARAAWEAEHKAIAAEVVRLAHQAGEIDALVAAQGELEAHEVLKPALPAWMFWRR